MRIEHTIKVDFQRPGVRPVVRIVEGDASTRYIVANLYNGGEPFSVGSGVTGVVKYAKSDGHSGVYDTIDKDKATEHAAVVFHDSSKQAVIELAPNISIGFGLVALLVQFVSTSGTDILGTFPVDVIVERDPTDGTEAEDYFSYKALDELYAAIDEAKAAAAENSEAISQLSESIADIERNKMDMYSKYVHVEISPTIGSMINVTNGSFTPTSGAQGIQYEVNEGETYRVSGWHFNSTYCGLSFTPNTIRQTDTVGAFTKVVTIPSGVTKMRINGRTSNPIIIERLVKSDSDTFWNDYRQNEEKLNELYHLPRYKNKVGVRRTDTGIFIYLDGYTATECLKYSFSKKAINNLWDFGSVSKVVKTGFDVPVTDESTPTYLYSSGTDFLSPSCVYAVNNANGDFPTLSTQKLTGGWHGYNNATSGSASATARNVSLKVYCDGKAVGVGETARGNHVVIDIVNRLQGSNTEKEDGTGREIVEQHFIIEFGDGFKAKIRGEIKALEDVLYSIYYGISTINLTNIPVRFIGCRTNRHDNAYNSVTRCGDKYCTGIQQIGNDDVYEMHINSDLDLGTMFANKWSNSCTMSSNKSYMVLIYGTDEGDMLNLSEGDKVYWEGAFEFRPVAK